MLRNIKYDICIIGGGVAGALIALHAARRGKKVVLVEAGKRFELSSRLDQLHRNQILGEKLWDWEIEGRDGYVDLSSSSLGYEYTLNDSRVKAIGGSTLHWGGLVQRLRESDFKTRSLYGLGIDWPISYEDLEPFYGRAEIEIGVSGIVNPTDPPRSTPYPMQGFPLGYGFSMWKPVAESMGVSLEISASAKNTRPYSGRSQCVAYAACSVCPSGAKYSANFHVDEAVKTGNCDLLAETVARRIVLNGNSVAAVYATSLSGETYEISAKNYVVAAHAVESARLLLLSKVGNDSDMVGRNLMEHWYTGAGGYHEKLANPGLFTFSTLESSHFYDGSERSDRGAIKLEFEGSDSPIKSVQGRWGKDLANLECERFGHWVGINAEVEHQPNHNSRVTLDKNIKDQFGDPVPKINFVISDVDQKTHQRALDVIAMMLEARGVKDIVELSKFERAHHHMGTCRMSDDPNSGVVDKDCRVHGVNNLYMAGASVFPTAGARQPTLTVAALSIRLADHLTAA